jgi:hypothetical protein
VTSGRTKFSPARRLLHDLPFILALFYALISTHFERVACICALVRLSDLLWDATDVT